jgi:hypothetical protein
MAPVYVIGATVRQAQDWARTEHLGTGEWAPVREAHDLYGHLGGRLVILAGAERRHDFTHLGDIARRRGMTFRWVDNP